MEYKKLDELLEYIQPTKYIVDSENYNDSFPTPVLTAGKSFILGYTDETNGIYFANKENPIILFDDFTTECKLVDFAFKVKSSACKILKPKKDVNIKYVYYAMKNIDIDTALHKRYWISIYSQQTIPFPIPIIQENIVSEIEVINKAIEYNEHKIKYLEELIKSQFIEMFGTLDLSEERKEWIEIKDVSKIYTGTTPSTADETYWEGDILWITPAEMNSESFYINDTVRKITEKGRKSKSLDLMPVNTVLLSTRAPIGKVGIVGVPMTCNQGFKNFECCNKLNPIYLYTLLKNNTEYLNTLGSGTTFLEVSKSTISKLRIPLPEIELQNKFADFVKQIDKSKLIVQQEIKLLNELLEVKTNEYFS